MIWWSSARLVQHKRHCASCWTERPSLMSCHQSHILFQAAAALVAGLAVLMALIAASSCESQKPSLSLDLHVDWNCTCWECSNMASSGMPYSAGLPDLGCVWLQFPLYATQQIACSVTKRHDARDFVKSRVIWKHGSASAPRITWKHAQNRFCSLAAHVFCINSWRVSV